MTIQVIKCISLLYLATNSTYKIYKVDFNASVLVPQGSNQYSK
uniref:Uncharacterized protein n=1 Tax=Arundo donax TaxID=35708 RepID=A0A0A9F1S9_ARUDO